MSEDQKTPLCDDDATPRASKAQITLYISYLLDMISKNKTRSECVKGLEATYQVNPHQGYKYFIKATEELESDLHDKTKNVRYRRIHALNKDIQDAYNNYLLATDESSKIKWYELYFKLKNQLDNYYPNALKPADKNDELNINIVYKKISKLDKPEIE